MAPPLRLMLSCRADCVTADIPTRHNSPRHPFCVLCSPAKPTVWQLVSPTATVDHGHPCASGAVSCRADRVTVGVTRFVISSLGEKYVTPPVLDYHAIYRQSTEMTPVVFVLSPGANSHAGWRAVVALVCLGGWMDVGEGWVSMCGVWTRCTFAGSALAGVMCALQS